MKVGSLRNRAFRLVAVLQKKNILLSLHGKERKEPWMEKCRKGKERQGSLMRKSYEKVKDIFLIWSWGLSNTWVTGGFYVGQTKTGSAQTQSSSPGINTNTHECYGAAGR